MFIVALRTNRHRFLKQLRISYDESLNRFMGLESQRKLRYADDTPWTTASPEGFYYTMYPLYDWKARDIWIYNARTRAIYNPLYDLMYRAGVPLRNMRVCEPFGPEQRKGLWLYHVRRGNDWSAELAVEGNSKRDWNRFLDTHYWRGWNVNVSRVMDNATHVAVYFGSYLKKPPVPMSRLEHYAGQDETGLRYNSHRTKREEYLVMSGDEFMERFSWHVADKGFRMVRYYGFLSPSKRRLLEEVVYVITETVRKTAMQIRWRGMYQRLLKVDPLKCVLCGSQMRFTGLKRGYRLAELVMMHEPLARMQCCG